MTNRPDLSDLLFALAAVPFALAGCDSSTELSTDPPTSVTVVTSGGFTAPVDAVASPDGETFYFAARDPQGRPAIFRTSSEPGSTATVMAAGAPLVEPSGLVLSCDGATLYVADGGGEVGALLALGTAGGAPRTLTVTGLRRPAGLAMASDCATLVATGRTATDQPALFRAPTGGGAAEPVHVGLPLVEPSGVFIDPVGVSWVMDRAAEGAGGHGVLFAIPSDGRTVTPVMGGLAMGTPGGVSLVAGGGTALMPTHDGHGGTQLTAVVIATGAVTQLPAPAIVEPGGLRTARAASVFAIADRGGDQILRAD